MASTAPASKKRKAAPSGEEEPFFDAGKRLRGDGAPGLPATNAVGTPSRRLAEWVKMRAAASALQQSTPTKSGVACPSPLHGSAVRRSGLAGETPQRLRQTAAKLPAKYALLAEFFSKLQTVYLLCKQRGQQCTFHAAKRPVEESAGRAFTVQHLLQLKEAFPDAFRLSSIVQSGQQAGGSAAKPTEQILIEMPLLRAARTPAARQDLRQQLVDKLLQRLHQHYRTACPAGGGDPDDPSSWDATFELEAVPDVPLAELPPPAGPAANASPGTPQSRPGGGTPGSSARKPPTAPRSSRLTGKKLTFPGGPVERAPSGGSSGFADFLDAGPAPDDGALDREMRRQSMDGTLPVSLAALQAIRRNQAAKAAAECAVAAEARARAAALDQLPRAFDAVRAAFGPSGPAALPLAKVLDRLEGAWGKRGAQDLPRLLDLLLEALPEWLSRSERAEVGAMLRVERGVDATQLRERLVQMRQAAADAS